MFGRSTVTAVFGFAFAVSLVFAACTLRADVDTGSLDPGLEENWNDFLHYARIGRLDLAAGYARTVLQSGPEPLEVLALSEKTPAAYAILLRIKEAAPDAELAEIGGKILTLIEQGRFIRRVEPAIITEEIRRLSTTARGRLAAVKRLTNAGEYAIPYMLVAMADDARQEELPNIVWALPQIGRPAIQPLVAALQTGNVPVKAEIIKALGKIGYPQSLAYLKYTAENEDSAELRELAIQSIKEVDPAALQLSAAQLFYRLAENYYYHTASLAPAPDADFANIWFWDAVSRGLVREKVDKGLFFELMAMRACEWALRADPGFGQAIGLWLAAYFKAEATGIDMPGYFGPDHLEAAVYATTAGPEYVHQALARAIKDKNAYVALRAVEVLATTAGEKSLFYRLGMDQPLVEALRFDDRQVRYSAAIAIASARPHVGFPESSLVAEILAEALEQSRHTNDSPRFWDEQLADSYAVRAAEAMLQLVETANSVIDLSVAQTALIRAAKGDNSDIQMLAGQILARLKNPDAQRAIAAMALDETNPVDVRISAFNSLAVSAKVNANLLDEQRIDGIYLLLGSRRIDPELRSAAASAFGALNLPSEKVKNLILDQARS